jgi:hypothetical protein
MSRLSSEGIGSKGEQLSMPRLFRDHEDRRESSCDTSDRLSMPRSSHQSVRIERRSSCDTLGTVSRCQGTSEGMRIEEEALVILSGQLLDAKALQRA